MTPSTKSDEERSQLIIELNQLTLDAYSRIELRKALLRFDYDVQRAATWMVTGEWRAAKLISWNHEALSDGAKELAERTGRPDADCYSMLKNCSGSVPLAIRTPERFQPFALKYAPWIIQDALSGRLFTSGRTTASTARRQACRRVRIERARGR